MEVKPEQGGPHPGVPADRCRHGAPDGAQRPRARRVVERRRQLRRRHSGQGQEDDRLNGN